MSARIQELDALRGLAAIAVVFYHYTTQFGKMFGHSEPLLWSMPWGDRGVHLFFMISGFVIFMTLNRAKRPLDFVVSRFSRLYPPYWFCLFLTVAVVAIWGLQGEQRSVYEILVNITMWQGVLEVKDVDGVYWTLMYELIFYVLMLVLLRFQLLKFVSLFIAVGLLMNIANSFVNFIPWKAQLFLLLQYNQLFGAGVLFFLIRNEGAKPQYVGLLGLCLVAQWCQGNIVTSSLVSVFFLLFALFIYGKLAFLANKPLIWLGSISYSLYLLHQNIGYVIIQQMESLGISPLIAILTALAFSLIAANYVVKYVERPSQKWIKARYTRAAV